MTTEPFPIPSRLNVGLALLLICLYLIIFWAAGQAEGWWVVALLAAAYAIFMNTGYALLHEAEHNLLHPNHEINEALGTVLALFFPAPFHLLRQGHLGHHLRNRSDDEAFDFYFEGENPVWKYLQFYGILTGLFWAVIALSNLLTVLSPRLLRPRYTNFDRPSQAVLESLNPRYNHVIQAEALLVFLLHGAMVSNFTIPIWHYVIILSAFGFTWSALQYVHHFRTVRDVRNGARNLKTWALLDMVWLNHNWHLRHHRYPTIPWIHLPNVDEGRVSSRGSLVLAYLRMWSGPRFSPERVQNLYADKIIR